MANRHVEELRRLTSRLALTEAQQRRVFFEGQIADSPRRDWLRPSKRCNPAAFRRRASCRAAGSGRRLCPSEGRGDCCSRCGCRCFAATLADGTPEVQQQLVDADRRCARSWASWSSAQRPPVRPTTSGATASSSTRRHCSNAGTPVRTGASLDEAREGALIQVVDTATVPEKKSLAQARVDHHGRRAGGIRGPADVRAAALPMAPLERRPGRHRYARPLERCMATPLSGAVAPAKTA
jgi:hypothetical protein